MGATKTVLRAAIQARADIKQVGTSTFITTTEMNGWIDDACRELYALIVDAYPDHYSSSETQTLTSTGLWTWVASDVYKIRNVEAWPDENREFQVPRMNGADRSARGLLRYRDRGAYIDFRPTTRAAGTIVRVRYVPKLTPPADNDSTQLDDTMDQWREYIVTEVAAKCLEADKDFEGAVPLRARKADLEAKLIAMVPEDVGQPEQAASMFNRVNDWFDEGPAY